MFKEGKTRMVGQPQRPPQPSRLGARAGWQARRGARRADASAVRTKVGGAQVVTNQVRALETGGRLCANQPGEGWTGGRLSHGAARWFGARPLGELNEDEGCVEERKEREVLRHPISKSKHNIC